MSVNVQAQTLLCGTQTTSHIVAVYRIVKKLHFDELLDTIRQKCQSVGFPVTPAIWYTVRVLVTGMYGALTHRKELVNFLNVDRNV